MKRKASMGIALLLSLVLLISMTACNTNPISTTQQTTTTSSGTTIEATTAQANSDGPMKKYDTPIDMIWGKMIDDTDEATINILSETPSPDFPNETYEDNRYTRLWEEALGINVSYKWITKGAEQVYQKLQMEIVSGDLPDYFPIDVSTGQGKLQFQQLVENDVIADISEIYSDYATPLLKQMLEPDGMTMLTDTARVNGKLYGIPNIQPLSNSTNYLYIRNDWLENLDLEAPKTLDQLVATIKAFTDDDPDNNGQADTVGMIASKELFFPYLGAFFNAFHAYPQQWYDDGSGKLVYGSIQPGTKLALQLMQELYSDGYIDREFGSKDWFTELTLVNSGKAGIFFGPPYMPLLTENIPETDPNAELLALPMPSADNEPVANMITPALFGGVIVAKKEATNPEAIVKMANLWVDMQYGDNGDKYAKYLPSDNTANVWRLCDIHVQDPFKEVKDAKTYYQAKAEGEMDELTGGAKVLHEMVQTGSFGWKSMMADNGSYYVMSQIYDSDQRYIYPGYVGAPTATQQEKGSMLSDLEITTFTKIILGELDADTGFDKFVSDWKRLGGDDIEQEINDVVSVN